jgi:biopolymer transport protein ExbD
MQNVEWVVLDDLNMNLIAALIVLILAASFTKTVDLPFALTQVEKKVETGTGKIRSTKVLVFRKNSKLMLRIGDAGVHVEKAETLLQKVNPSLPVLIAAEKDSGLSYEQLVNILAILKSKGVQNVSLIVESP